MLSIMGFGNPAKKQAKYAKQTRNAARVTAVATVVSARDQRKFAKQQQAAAMVPPPPVMPPGWYPVAQDPRLIIWWDGARWIPESRRFAQPQIPQQIPPR